MSSCCLPLENILGIQNLLPIARLEQRSRSKANTSRPLLLDCQSVDHVRRLSKFSWDRERGDGRFRRSLAIEFLDCCHYVVELQPASGLIFFGCSPATVQGLRLARADLESCLIEYGRAERRCCPKPSIYKVVLHAPCRRTHPLNHMTE